jgi:hypothetical protein
MALSDVGLTGLLSVLVLRDLQAGLDGACVGSRLDQAANLGLKAGVSRDFFSLTAVGIRAPSWMMRSVLPSGA